MSGKLNIDKCLIFGTLQGHMVTIKGVALSFTRRFRPAVLTTLTDL